MIGWQLVRLIHEAAITLTGGVVESLRFDKNSGRLLLQIGSSRGKRFAVIGVRPPKPTLYWVIRRADLANAEYEPTERFNRLRGARLRAVELPRADRLLRIDFEKSKDNDTSALGLWIGWLGGAGNAWLVDPINDTILEVLWKTSTQGPGQCFEPPAAPSLLDWRTITFPEYEKEREALGVIPLGRFLRKRIWGIDESLASLIESRIDEADLWNEFSSVVALLRHLTDPLTALRIERDDNDSPRIAPADDTHTGSEFTNSLAHILARLDREEIQTSNRERALENARRQIESRIKQLRRRLALLEQAIADGERAEPTKRVGDLLNANRHLMKRGLSSVALPDWETGGTRTVDLDSKLSPQENIEAYYKRARKLARGAEQASHSIPTIKAELEEAETQFERVEAGGVDSDELKSMTNVGSRRRQSAKAQEPRVPYREFAIGKFTVLVGKSRRDNDELTLHVARPHDLFLHADKVGGSHVIIRVPEKGHDIPRDVLTAAAQAAAYFSKAKHSNLVPVIYTEVRYVTKPRKAPPGLVRVSREQSLMVEPIAPPGYHDDDAGA